MYHLQHFNILEGFCRCFPGADGERPGPVGSGEPARSQGWLEGFCRCFPEADGDCPETAKGWLEGFCRCFPETVRKPPGKRPEASGNRPETARKPSGNRLGTALGTVRKPPSGGAPGGRYPITAPFVTVSSGVTKRIVPSPCFAIRIIPFDSIPRITLGVRLARMQICFPTISSGE